MRGKGRGDASLGIWGKESGWWVSMLEKSGVKERKREGLKGRLEMIWVGKTIGAEGCFFEQREEEKEGRKKRAPKKKHPSNHRRQGK